MKKLIAIMAVLAIAAPVMAFHGDPDWQLDDYDCATCHIPHTNSNVGRDGDDSVYGVGNGDLGVPLWSGRDIEGEEYYDELEFNWTMYSSETLNADMPGAPRGSTILCMSCHDRVHKDPAGRSSGYTINSTNGDLSTSHPVDFVYDDALAVADGELVLPSSGNSFLTRGAGPYTIENDLLYTASGASGKVVNCISCHEIHQNGLHNVTVAGTEDVTTPGPTPGDPDVVTPTPYEHSLHIPRLQPLDTPVPIGFELGRGGSELVKDDWELNYGGLCKTCHIK